MFLSLILFWCSKIFYLGFILNFILCAAYFQAHLYRLWSCWVPGRMFSKMRLWSLAVKTAAMTGCSPGTEIKRTLRRMRTRTWKKIIHLSTLPRSLDPIKESMPAKLFPRIIMDIALHSATQLMSQFMVSFHTSVYIKISDWYHSRICMLNMKIPPTAS